MRTTLKSLVVPLAALLVATASAAWAQGGSGGQDQQVAKDQQVDLALGALDTEPMLQLLTVPTRPGTHGRLPFDQQPPAAQEDFSETSTTPVVPCGKFCR